jgi:hypothetical protein
LKTFILFLTILFLGDTMLKAEDYFKSLSGKWSFSMHFDKIKHLISEEDLNLSVNLPGSMQSQGFGYDIDANTKWTLKCKDTSWIKNSGTQADGSFKIAAFLQPKKHFVGKVYYQKEFIISDDWNDKIIELYLERVHISSTVYLDGKRIGEVQNSLSTPHIHKLGKLSSGKHILVIEVDNSLPAPVGINSHCVTDHAQTNWNGIIGKIQLRALPHRSIKNIIIIPDVKNKKISARIVLDGDDNEQKGNILKLKVIPPKSKKKLNKSIEKNIICDWKEVAVCDIPLGDDIISWNEYNPQVYTFTAEMIENGLMAQTVTTTFGMVEYKIKNQQFFVNDQITLLRGTLECATFPKTAYPPTDIKAWKQIFSKCKEFGLNHIRFHSWTPPEAAFYAADDIGIYLQCEHAWANISNEKLQNYVEEETERVFNAYGNHPSFMIATYGNEPSGCDKAPFWLYDWVEMAKIEDFNRRIYTSAAGWGTSKNSDFYDVMHGMRVYPWNAGLNSSINKDIPSSISDFRETTQKHPDKPFIAHESGQWCAYPDFKEIKEYTGFLQPENFKIFLKNFKENNLMSLSEKFFQATGKLQTLCYKYEIEKLRRTPGCGGYQLLGLNDFPGQGTAPVGAINAFWKTKSYTSAAEYSKFNGKCVILARFPTFIFGASENPLIEIDLSNYSNTPIETAKLYWQVLDDKNDVCRFGSEFINKIPLGLSVLKKDFYLDFTGLDAPGAYKLVLSLKEFSTVSDTAFQDVENSWNFWVYSENINSQNGDVLIVKTFEEALPLLAKGEKVLLVPEKSNIILPEARPPIIGFSTIFWNTIWTNRQPPTTMGIFCEPDKPVFEQFPTSYHSDYQWWYIIQKTVAPFCLDSLPPKFQPLIYMIDDWFTARRLGLMLECNYLKGKLLISSIDISKQIENNLPLNQLRKSVLSYMNSFDFNPSQSLTDEQIKSFLKK